MPIISQRKEKAKKFIRDNQDKYTKKELIDLLMINFGYQRSSAFNLLRHEHIQSVPLRQKLEELERKEQRKYEDLKKAEIENRPKIRIDY